MLLPREPRRLRRHHITGIPVREDQKEHRRRRRGRAGGRPPVFDPGCYKKRNTVERCFSKLTRGPAVRVTDRRRPLADAW